MGTSPKVDGRAPVHVFASSKSWIEGNATRQLEQVSALPGIQAVAAMPDLHPGKYGPVGCAILSDCVYPQFVGSDIGCGMGLFELDIAVRKLRLDRLADRLHILDQSVGSQRLHVRHAGREIVVGSLKSRPGAMEQFRGDGHVTLLGKALRNISNVRIHAKRFLKNEQARQLSPIAGSGNERVHRGSIRYLQRYVFRAQGIHRITSCVVSYESRDIIATAEQNFDRGSSKFHCAV